MLLLRYACPNTDSVSGVRLSVSPQGPIAQWLEQQSMRRFESCSNENWIVQLVEHHIANVEDEVHRFTKNGDQKLKPGYFFQVWPMAAFAR